MSSKTLSTSPDPARLSSLTSSKGWWIQTAAGKQDGSDEQCVPCGGTADEQSNKLCKDFKFRNFKEAWAFMGVVADKAESLNHHPEWSNVYNRVSIQLTTHSANSTVTSLDTELAEACEAAREDILAKRPPKKAAAN